jgi:NADPH:quinone reductase
MPHKRQHESQPAPSGLTAKTILRAAKLRPGQTALVIGATTDTGTILMSLLAETGAHVIDSATDRIDHTTADPVTDALRAHPDLDLLVDLVSWGEPYFITRAARDGTIVSAQPRPDGPSIPRIRISAEPGDLAALAQLAPDEPQLVGVRAVEPAGIEPATSCLQSRRSPN